MPKLIFYRQQREDGGVRMGIDLNGDRIFERFDRGPGESDPGLIWYVDVILENPDMPTAEDDLRPWLLDQSDIVINVLREMADHVPAGMDPGDWPYHHQRHVGELRLKVICSAIRRLEAREIGARLRDVADHWREYVGVLEPAHAA